MQVGVEVLEYQAPVRSRQKRFALWIVRALAIPVLIAIVGYACYQYTRYATLWESDTTRYTFGDFPPLYATYTPRELTLVTPLVVPALIALAWIVVLVVQAQRKIMPEFLFVLIAAGFVFSINMTVAMIDGREAPFWPFARSDLEYIGDVSKVGADPAKFVREYPGLNSNLTIHPGTHPPGGVLFLYYVEKWFGFGIKTASYSAIVFTSLGVIPAYLLARRLFGAKSAVIAAGMYAVTPSLVIFGATSMDGVFVFFPVLGAWLLHEAIARKSIAWTIVIAILAGAALTAAMFMTFATLCIGIIYIVYALITSKKDFPRVLLALGTALGSFILCNVMLYLTIGYDPIACLFAAIDRDARTVGTGIETSNRYYDLSLGNFFAFVFGVGIPAMAAFLRTVGRTRMATTFAIAIVLISFSSMFTLETERIWIFMMPLLLAPAAWKLSESCFWPYVVIALMFAQTWWMEAMLYTHW